jgi:hypothetical protein
MPRRLTKSELVQIVTEISRPDLFSSQEINDKLYLFAINCPDPVRAMSLIVEDTRFLSEQQLVEEALAMAPRDPKGVPFSELPQENPLRQMNLD